ncbi:[LysW]-aminoadipate kinase [Phototrophicus methaneseepsis]|uniref:[LysW]-aminoadipate kinase n=1 Tax=Phototrophicus methaneseepsis TaxID=2710758 RepID=A0A7S8IDL0_9CHLR|nr:[LysW]-aminoadipate kinase [Phototrophicus methaneseepsis]QPC81646.1 [LysW]-aminoadipate kinase [Phototrophicus methaneseepsis]
MNPTTQTNTAIENILVVKLGGGAGLDIEAACADLAQLAQTRPVVVVHGVSEAMAQLCEERGVPVETLTSPSGHSSRYTPPATRDLFVEAAQGVNDTIVHELRSHGIYAIGLTQEIAIQGERKAAIRAVVSGRIRVVRDDYSGSITGVNAGPIWEALSAGRVAVLPPLAASEDGLLNIDGDRAAAALAGALGATDLVILSNVAGLMRDHTNTDTLIQQVTGSDMDRAMNYAQGRMKRKVLGAQEALENGVRRVTIGDGRTQSPIANALNGAGTVFTR